MGCVGGLVSLPLHHPPPQKVNHPKCPLGERKGGTQIVHYLGYCGCQERCVKPPQKGRNPPTLYLKSWKRDISLQVLKYGGSLDWPLKLYDRLLYLYNIPSTLIEESQSIHTPFWSKSHVHIHPSIIFHLTHSQSAILQCIDDICFPALEKGFTYLRKVFNLYFERAPYFVLGHISRRCKRLGKCLLSCIHT